MIIFVVDGDEDLFGGCQMWIIGHSGRVLVTGVS